MFRAVRFVHEELVSVDIHSLEVAIVCEVDKGCDTRTVVGERKKEAATAALYEDAVAVLTRVGHAFCF